MTMHNQIAHTPESVSTLLRSHNITPTTQRIEIARVLFSRCEHLSADEVYTYVNAEAPQVSKATVYNTLGLFAEHGLVRELIVDPSRVFYDPNTSPHHHFFDTTTGTLTDIPAEAIEIRGLPPVPEGAEMEGVDVIVRVRRAS